MSADWCVNAGPNDQRTGLGSPLPAAGDASREAGAAPTDPRRDATAHAAGEAPLHASLLRQLAKLPGGAWVTCAGRSMEPTIPLGTRVRVVACDRVWPGQVALFEALRGGYVLHRVVFPVPGTGWFVHIGDASGAAPGVAHRARLIGRALVPARIPTASVWAAAIARAARAGWRQYG